jgi:adenine phosphoribosyltransferase
VFVPFTMIQDVSIRFQNAVRDVHDFPKQGIVFKDLGKVWADAQLCVDCVDWIADQAIGMNIEAVAGIESRGFLFGMPLAMRLGVPFIPIRKAGKLPGPLHAKRYELEYGTATLEMQKSALVPGQRVLVHDDVLATGGTASACGDLIEQCGAEVSAWSFLVELGALKGRENLVSGGEFIRPLLRV